MDTSKKRRHEGAEVAEAETPKKKVSAFLPFQATKSSTRTLKSTNTGTGTYAKKMAHEAASISYKSSILAHNTTDISAPPPIPKKTFEGPQKDQISKNVTITSEHRRSDTDYTIKRSLTAFTTHSIDWATAKTPLDWGPSTSNQNLSPGDLLHHSLTYYQYPDNLFSKDDDYAGLNIEEDNSSIRSQEYGPILLKLRERWPDALNSAYNATLNTPNRSFYLVCKKFSLFVYSTSNRSIVACMNSTSFSIRKAMTSAGIKFSLPYHKDKTSTNMETSTTDNPEIDYRIESLILVKGEDSTKSLIDYFIQCFQKGERWFGICPSIISSFPFHCSTVCSLKLVAKETKVLGNNGTMAPYNYLTVTGPILPEAFKSILDAFQSVLLNGQDASISCQTIDSTLWCGASYTNQDGSPPQLVLESTIYEAKVSPELITLNSTIRQKRD